MVDKTRIRQLNNGVMGTGPIVYWMNRDQRAQDNWALLYAQELATKHKQALVVVFNLDTNFLGGGRHLAFKIGGLREVAAVLESKDIPFIIVSEEKGAGIVSWFKEKSISAIVTDMSPLRTQRDWLKKIVGVVSIPVYQVDAHNIIPVWVTSDKAEYAARTIRPKIYRQIEKYLVPFPPVSKQKIPAPKQFNTNTSILNGWADSIDSKFLPGAKAAKKVLKEFLTEKVGDYAEDRNDPLRNGSSNLSPYLHYGQISPARVVLEVVAAAKKPITKLLDPKRNMAADNSGYSAFLEEAIVRRELADNFCWYAKNYDRLESAPAWAQKTLQARRKDVREYIYTKSQFELAQTHDELWNAAQVEMMETGKMSGYVRMYWAKKILEWTPNPEKALEIAIYLNDKYEIDGRDPNGYAGILWSVAGLHDRPWFNRPIFGTVRYMALSGMKKKFDVDAYIKLWQG